jgi:hypothetical protein
MMFLLYTIGCPEEEVHGATGEYSFGMGLANPGRYR